MTSLLSLSDRERRRLEAIYREFVVGRNGEMPNGEGARVVGGRTSFDVISIDSVYMEIFRVRPYDVVHFAVDSDVKTLIWCFFADDSVRLHANPTEERVNKRVDVHAPEGIRFLV